MTQLQNKKIINKCSKINQAEAAAISIISRAVATAAGAVRTAAAALPHSCWSQKGSIQFDNYREYLFSRKEQHRKMNVIRSHCHIPKKLIKLPSLLTMTNELLWTTEYTL